MSSIGLSLIDPTHEDYVPHMITMAARRDKNGKALHPESPVSIETVQRICTGFYVAMWAAVAGVAFCLIIMLPLGTVIGVTHGFLKNVINVVEGPMPFKETLNGISAFIMFVWAMATAYFCIVATALPVWSYIVGTKHPFYKNSALSRAIRFGFYFYISVIVFYIGLPFVLHHEVILNGDLALNLGYSAFVICNASLVFHTWLGHGLDDWRENFGRRPAYRSQRETRTKPKPSGKYGFSFRPEEPESEPENAALPPPHIGLEDHSPRSDSRDVVPVWSPDASTKSGDFWILFKNCFHPDEEHPRRCEDDQLREAVWNGMASYQEQSGLTYLDLWRALVAGIAPQSNSGSVFKGLEDPRDRTKLFQAYYDYFTEAKRSQSP